MDRRRALVSAAVLLGGTSCGYLLYPGRRGRASGRIDVPVLIIDVLWFIPGLVPGLVCLIVDFASGAIYEGGERAATSSPPSAAESREATVQLDLDGEVVASGAVRPDRSAHLSWSRTVDEATLRSRAHVTVRTGGGALARAGVGPLLEGRRRGPEGPQAIAE